MMLHRHFNNDYSSGNITTLADVAPEPEPAIEPVIEPEIEPVVEPVAEEAPRRRGRPRKTESV